MWSHSQDSLKQRPAAGFTLIEILITTTLGLLLLGGTLAAYNSFTNRQTKIESARDVMAVLRLAQSQSRDGNKPDTGCATMDGYRVWGTQGTQNYGMALRCNDDGIDQEVQSFQLQAGEVFLDSFEVLFPPLPGPVPGTPVTVKIGDLGNQAVRYEFSVSEQGVVHAGQLFTE